MSRALACAVLVLSTPIFSSSKSQNSDSEAPSAACAKLKNWPTCSSDITPYIDASFIYWYAYEEGLTLAVNGVLVGAASEHDAVNTGTLFQSSNYKPGFKVGAGLVGLQDWLLHAEYTWYHVWNKTPSTPPPAIVTGISVTGSPVWDPGGWYIQAPYGPAISSTWHLGMDLVDVVAGRPFYQGKCLTFSPFGGLRAAFISQSFTVTLDESIDFDSGGPYLFSPPNPFPSYNHSKSWAIGLRAGCEGQYLLPIGFRFEGALGTSLLYTQYTTIKHSESPVSPTLNPGPYTAFYHNFNCLRPELDLGLGFGWETCFSDHYHVDFSANYDFMVFWEQNMMRKLIQGTRANSVLQGGVSVPL
jgi:hypothetical protein